MFLLKSLFDKIVLKGGMYMLLIEEMKSYPFSHTEKIVIDFILEKKEEIEPYSTNQVAKETYTSPSILIRIAKKLNFKGWIDFKEAFLAEQTYLNSHFVDLDANYPFQGNDTIMNISRKISQLHIESVNDTLSLMTHDDLQKAVQIVRKSKEVQIFGVSNINFFGLNFAQKLNRINIPATCDPISENLYQNAAMMKPGECAICISYSGQTVAMLKVAKILKNKHIPIIAITSIGNNDLSKIADVTLHVSTRERSYSKIGPFVSEASISLVLDILYSCIFSLNYKNNLEYKLEIASQIETGRNIENPIITETKV